MQKQDLLSKISRKDYNNILETILEKKQFTLNTKNLLLGMLYKIETSYHDYQKVKRQTKPKSEFIEEILETIEKKCEEIELVEPRSEKGQWLNKIKEEAIVYEKKIIAYPTERALLTGICKIKNKEYSIHSKYKLIKQPLELILKRGEILNQKEVIYNFDGWSWNIELQDQKEIIYNLLYQNLLLFLGNDFLEKWQKDKTLGIDYIEKAKKKLYQICEEEVADGIVRQLKKVLLIILIQEYPKQVLEWLKEKREIHHQLSYMENKTKFLEDISNKKKQLTNQIKEIDNILIHEDILVKEYKTRNEKLPLEKKIFSMRCLKDILKQEKIEILEQIKEHNKMLEPKNYIERKKELMARSDELEILNIKHLKQQDLIENIIYLQKEYIKALNQKAEKLEEKRDILDMLYMVRYYQYNKITKNSYIYEIDTLKETIQALQAAIIVKAVNVNILTKFNNSMIQNIEITQQILNTKIIDLEEIQLLFKVIENRIHMEIYDGEILDKTITFGKNIKVVDLKPNKKVKLFN